MEFRVWLLVYRVLLQLFGVFEDLGLGFRQFWGSFRGSACESRIGILELVRCRSHLRQDVELFRVG